MIDTVVLAVPMRYLVPNGTTCDGRQEWRAWGPRTNSRGFPKYILNAPDDEEKGGYYPRLTGYRMKKDGASYANIEFSAAKMAFGNNLDELDEGMLDDVLDELCARLVRMGLQPRKRALKYAKVMKIDYSKNFIFIGGHTAANAISHMNRANVSRRLKHAKIVYRNGGMHMSARTKSYSVELYDKVAELKHDLGVGVLEKLGLAHNVLRLEVRLANRAKVNRLFDKLAFGKDPTFKEAFSMETSRAVLSHYWNEIIARDASVLYTAPMSPKEMLRQILRVRPLIQAKRAMALVGLVLLARDGGGMDELRSMLVPRLKSRSWSPIPLELRELSRDLGEMPREDWYIQLERQLRDFVPVRLLTNKQ